MAARLREQREDPADGAVSTSPDREDKRRMEVGTDMTQTQDGTGFLPAGRWLPLMLTAALTAGLSACVAGLPTASSQNDPGEVRSTKPRVTSPASEASELTDLVAGNSTFTFDLYRMLREEDGNLFYSPYSISVALAMTYAGARGETERQMADVLHFRLPRNRLHPSFNTLDLDLASRGEGSRGRDGKGFRLKVVNAMWGQEGYAFLPDFLDLLAENYGAGIRQMDFVAAAEAARVTINDWVADQTEDRIQDLIPRGTIDRNTRLLLTNAITFNAAWLRPFDERLTRDRPFRLLDGSRIDVPAMTQTASFGHARGDGYQAVELLYDGSEIAMVILLPDEGAFSRFEGSINAGLVRKILGEVRRGRVVLTVPRFEFETEFSLRKALAPMGMPDAFDAGKADFTGMAGGPSLYISDAFHKAFVSVDESGTEAAAATGVGVGVTSVPPSVKIDRPFIFLIRDIATDAILFVGRVVDPRA